MLNYVEVRDMGVNRGKKFESVVKECLEKVPGTVVERLHDQTTGYAGSYNICDFIAYRYPTQFYLECKSIHGNTWALANLTDNQYKGLLSKSGVKGVVPGVLVWWIDRDVTTFFHIDYIKKLKDEGYKSIHYANEKGVTIPGKKKRVFFDYDFTDFLGVDKWENLIWTK